MIRGAWAAPAALEGHVRRGDVDRIRLGLVALAVLATLLAGSVGWPDPLDRSTGAVASSASTVLAVARTAPMGQRWK